MDIICTSACIPYTTITPTTAMVTIPTSAYMNCSANPLLVTISVAPDPVQPSRLRNFTISIGPTGNTVSYVVILEEDQQNGFVKGTLSNIPSDVNITFKLGPSPLQGYQNIICGGDNVPKASITQVQLGRNLNLPSYKFGDIYEINMLQCCNGSIQNAQVTLTSPTRSVIGPTLILGATQ